MRARAIILILVGAFAGSACGGQRAVEEWVARYDSNSDSAGAMAMDDSGSVYVTGTFSNESGEGCTTVKYTPDGNEQWVASYDDGQLDVSLIIAVDSSGNVYLATTAFADYSLVKYDANGTEVWTARYGGPGDGTDEPHAMVVDDAGNVYVTGNSWGDGTEHDYATVKYGPDSNQPIWAARYNGPGNGWDVARDIAVDGSGNVYVTGWSDGVVTGYDYDHATIKYGPDSNQPVWVARYNGPANGDDEGHAIAVDSSGYIYVTGSEEGMGTYSDLVTIKYGPDSNQPMWVATYDGPVNEFDWGTAIATDASGNVYVAGTSDGGATDLDYVTIKYGADSNIPIWVARYNGTGNDKDGAIDIALDGSGNVYVTGDSPGSGTGYDYATVKYDANGVELWSRRYNGPDNGWERPVGVAVDEIGNVYVAGSSANYVTEYDVYATVKYKQCTQEGDIDCDRDVDFGDYAVLGDYWWQSDCGECGWADLDENETVDYNDLKKLCDNWLEGAEE